MCFHTAETPLGRESQPRAGAPETPGVRATQARPQDGTPKRLARPGAPASLDQWIPKDCIFNGFCGLPRAYVETQRGFPGVSVVKNSPAMQEAQIPSLAGEDPLKKEMAPHSSILAWRLSWTEEPGGLQSME